MTKQKHQLGIPPKQKNKAAQNGALDQFVQPVEPIPSAEEAVLQFLHSQISPSN
jgi:hypothetical protein